MNQEAYIYTRIETRGSAVQELGNMSSGDFSTRFEDGSIQTLVARDYPELREANLSRAGYEVIHSIARLGEYIDQRLAGLGEEIKFQLIRVVEEAFLHAILIRRTLAEIRAKESFAIRMCGLRPITSGELDVISESLFGDRTLLSRSSEGIIPAMRAFVDASFLQSIARFLGARGVDAERLLKVGLYNRDHDTRENIMVECGLRGRALSTNEARSDPLKNIVIIPILQIANLLSQHPEKVDLAVRIINAQLNGRVLARRALDIAGKEEYDKSGLNLVFFLKGGIFWFGEEDVAGTIGKNIKELGELAKREGQVLQKEP
ncbi:hypothetical protein JW766_02675 [Candidatus Dojkabacteria bacterium]|nr:hypothetical protein [Candidatus Dojkabacteria bacterium]